ncbi:MAG: flagellar hook-basal body complex protein FliE [Deltaproteobacteria bacterium]|nr:MAG: flagellar hook-basal body complex protein FliE [Deltaproteobacteria bacterium]
MSDISIQNDLKSSFDSEIQKINLPKEQHNSFGEILSKSINEVNQYQNEADMAMNELAMGRQTDIHQTMIAIEKAEVSFKLMMQVRNKIISAYEEVKRMQF